MQCCSRQLPGCCGHEDVGTTQLGLEFDTEIPQQRLGKPQFCSMERKREIQGMSKKNKTPYLTPPSPQRKRERRRVGGAGSNP